MTEYTYTRHNLFDAPEFYHYAQCNQADYLEAWRTSRRAFIAGLVGTRAAASKTPAAAVEVLEARLARQLDEVRIEDGFSAAAIDVVDHLVHKYEVSRRLYQDYAADWRRLAGVPVAGMASYLFFAELLVLHCRHLPLDRQKLSTLIKLCDALASLDPAMYTHRQSLILEDVLVAEDELVGQLAGGRS